MNTTVSNKKRKALIIVLSLVLVAAVAVGGTLAYLSSLTNEEENVFTFADNVSADLDEPSWNPKDAEDLVPGKEIPKDPMLTNTSSNKVDEYGAIKVSFVDGAGVLLKEADMTKLLGLITIDWNTDDWTIADAEMTDKTVQVWYYNDILAPAYQTTPLFETVTINQDITPDELAWLAGKLLPEGVEHDEDCYVYGTCDCDVTYIHDDNCALMLEEDPDAATTPEGETTDAGNTCDCHPAERHENGCPALIGTLIEDCKHAELMTGLSGFTINVQGAVVQADAFDSAADAAEDLISLLS